MEERKFNKKEGITLVALVITIIVLLILAGVSLSLVAGGNGILGRSEKAVTATNISAGKEQAELLVAEYLSEFI